MPAKRAPIAVRTDPYASPVMPAPALLCLNCGAVLSGKAKMFCSSACKAGWHRKNDPPELLSTAAVALLSGKSRYAVKRAAERGELLAVEIDGRWNRRVFLRAEVERWLGDLREGKRRQRANTSF